jgi:hypothetical protein
MARSETFMAARVDKIFSGDQLCRVPLDTADIREDFIKFITIVIRGFSVFSGL